MTKQRSTPRRWPFVLGGAILLGLLLGVLLVTQILYPYNPRHAALRHEYERLGYTGIGEIYRTDIAPNRELKLLDIEPSATIDRVQWRGDVYARVYQRLRELGYSCVEPAPQLQPKYLRCTATPAGTYEIRATLAIREADDFYDQGSSEIYYYPLRTELSLS